MVSTQALESPVTCLRFVQPPIQHKSTINLPHSLAHSRCRSPRIIPHPLRRPPATVSPHFVSDPPNRLPTTSDLQSACLHHPPPVPLHPTIRPLDLHQSNTRVPLTTSL